MDIIKLQISLALRDALLVTWRPYLHAIWRGEIIRVSLGAVLLGIVQLDEPLGSSGGGGFLSDWEVNV